MKKAWLSAAVIFASLAAFIVVWQCCQSGTVGVIEAGSDHAAQKPARIVSLAPNLTEILFALGLKDRIAAVSSDSDYPPEAAEKKKVGTFWQPNCEAIIACRPDLVIALLFEQQKGVADTLTRLGYKVLTLKIKTIQELLTAIGQIGDATGSEQRADEVIREMSSQLAGLEAKFQSARKVKVLWVVQSEPLRVASTSTFINELVELAGGQNAVGPTVQQYPEIGTEQLLASGAEVIIQSAMGAGDIASEKKAADFFWRKWPALPAVKNARIYVVDPDTILRLGPRLPQGVEIIGDRLHAGDLH
ncbi:MAG: ABC transporter substrate-binding protein [Planctomycetota bacterium]|jgi:iron complex transport system substrate-binding protein